MRLARYLETTRTPVMTLAADLGIAPQTIYRWLSGDRYPRPEMMARIHTATGGRVRAADWYAQRVGEAVEA